MNRPIYRRSWLCVSLLASVACFSEAFAASQLNAYNYQGLLEENGAPANGVYNIDFELFDAQTNGNPVGPVISFLSDNVYNGLISGALNFGDVFDGTQLYLEVSVDGVILSPRTPIYLAPAADFAKNVADHSISRDSLDGAQVTGGSISVTDLAPGACFVAGIALSGAQVNDMVIFNFAGTANVPAGLQVTPLQVKTANQVNTRLCNIGSSALTVSDLPVLIQTIR
jgi:hypothetical protein